MSNGGGATLSAADQGKLRHDLRTPFNALQGYTEMLLETAAEDGLESLVPALEQVHAALATERAVTDADLLALGQSIQGRLKPLARQIDDVVRQGKELAPADVGEVLGRLHVAAALLGQLTQEHLLDRQGQQQQADEPPGDLKAPAPPEARAGTPPAEDQRPPLGGKVLVVDDSETNRDLLCRRLEREGCRTATAADGREALARMQAEAFDLVLLDLLMPEMDGYEALCAIRASPSWREIPVIMISALDEMRSVVRCIEMGAEDYLPKPFDPVLLRARVGACLEKKRLRDKELEYLRGVQALETAASAVEEGSFDAGVLQGVSARADELGRLARVFQRMASEVKAREQRLKEELEQLRIHEIVIDPRKVSEQVEAVTSGDLFDAIRNARERRQRRT